MSVHVRLTRNPKHAHTNTCFNRHEGTTQRPSCAFLSLSRAAGARLNMDDQNDSHDPTKVASNDAATTPTPTQTTTNAETLQSNDVIELQAFLEV